MDEKLYQKRTSLLSLAIKKKMFPKAQIANDKESIKQALFNFALGSIRMLTIPKVREEITVKNER